MSDASEEKLRALWAATLPGGSLDDVNPGATVKRPDPALAAARTVGLPSQAPVDRSARTLGATPPAAVDMSARTLAAAAPAPVDMSGRTLAEAPAPLDATSRTLTGAPAADFADAKTMAATASGTGAPAGMSGAATWDGGGGSSGAEAGLTLPTIRLGAPEAGAAAAAGSAGVQPSYELLDEIGRGGMGVVYRARQGSLRRLVAVKRSLGGVSAAAREPFIAEALVTGLLDHPNIVPVHELGATAEGEVFLAMKLVDGAPWSRLLHPRDGERARAEALSVEDHLAILVDVCNAIAFAHERGFVHADLKPENVMVGAFGEVVVMDWGVAVSIAERRQDAPGIVRHASEVARPCGTPSYMPPELAEGRGVEIGPWTDVYLLGAILHEVLTGAPPHRGERLIDVLLHAIASPPPAFGREVPLELAGIARRAMSREPKERFPDARALRDALKAHLRHRESIAIEAAARALLERARSAAREPESPGSALATEPAEARRSRLYADLAEAVAGFRQALVLWPGNDEARRGEREGRLETARAALAASDLGLADAQARALGPSDEEGRAISASVRERRLEIERAARHGRLLRRGIVVAVLCALASLSAGYVLVRAERDRAEESALEARRQEEIAVRARAESQRKLARSLLAEGDALEGAGRATDARGRFDEARGVLSDLGEPLLAADLGVFAADRRASRPLASMGAPEGPALSVALSPDRSLVLVGDGRGDLDILRRATGTLEMTVHVLDGPADAIAVSADGSRALLGSSRGMARAVDLASGRPLAVAYGGGGPPIHAVSVSPDGMTGVLARGDGTIAHVDLASGLEIGVFAGHEGPVLSAFISPDGRIVYSTGADGTARHWALSRRSLLWTFKGHKGAVRAAALTFDGHLLTGGDDRTLRLFLVRSGLEEGRLEGPAGPVTAIALTPDARTAIVASQERTLRVYDLVKGELVRALDDPTGPARSLAVSAEGALLAAAGRDGRVRLYDLARIARRGEVGLEARLLAGPAVRGPVLLAAGGLVALTAGERGVISARDARTGRVLCDFSPSGETPSALCGLPEADRALAAYADGSLVVLDLATGRVARPYAAIGIPRARSGLALAANGRRAVVPGGAGTATATLYDLLDGTASGKLHLLPGRESVLAISPDGDWAAAGGGDEGFQVVEMRIAGSAAPLEERPKALGRHDAPVRGICYLPGPGRFAATGGEDGTVRIFDCAAGALVRALPAPGPVISLSAAAAPEGTLILAGLADGGLALFDLGRPAVERALEASLPDAAARGRLLAHRGAFDLAAEALSGPDGAPLEPDPLPDVERARLSWERGDLLGAGRAFDRAIARASGPRWFLESCRARVEADLERSGSAVGRATDILREVAVTPDGRHVLTVGREPRLRCFSLEGALETWSAILPDEVYSLALSPDGRTAAVGGRGERVFLVDAASGRIARSVTLGEEPLRALGFADGGRLLVAVAHEGPVRAFDVESGREAAAVTIPGRVTALGTDGAGARVVAGTRLGSLHVFDVTRPSEAPRALPSAVGESSIDEIALLPGGSRAIIRAGSTLRIVDLESGAAVRDVGPGMPSLQSVELSPDGKSAAGGSMEGVAHILDLETGRALSGLTGHRGIVSGATFTPDGRVVVTCATDCRVLAHRVDRR